MNAISPDTNYRDILKREMHRRKSSNPRYGLRAFARDLDVGHSRLSQVLNGKKGLSVEAATKLVWKLNLSENERQKFILSAHSHHARGEDNRLRAVEKLQSFNNIKRRECNDSDFIPISKWYYLAILELLSSKIENKNTKKMASMLALSEEDLHQALMVLMDHGHVVYQDKSFYAVDDDTIVPGGVPSEAVKSFHCQILDKAKEAIINKPINKRESRSLIISHSQKGKVEIQKLIKKFKMEMDEIIKSTGPADQLSVININFFEF